MRFTLLFTALLFVATFASAQDPKPYRSGTLSQADAASCSANQEKSKGHACQQYILEADGVDFRIRPKREKQTTQLSDGGRAEFRIQNGNIMLRMEGIDSKEREYIVVSIAPHSESNTADARSMRVNHLQ